MGSECSCCKTSTDSIAQQTQCTSDSPPHRAHDVLEGGEEAKKSDSPRTASNKDSPLPCLDLLVECIVKSTDTLRFLDTKNKDKNMIVMLGNSGSGKSTSVNFLLGHDLHYCVKDGVSLGLEVRSSLMNIPKIGHTQNSETLYPEVYDVSGLGFVCDFPGFIDTRGPETSIASAICIHTIMSKAVSLKFIVCINCHSLFVDRGNGVKTTIKLLRKLLGEQLANFAHSFLFAVTNARLSEKIKVIKMLQETLAAFGLENIPENNVVLMCPHKGDEESGQKYEPLEDYSLNNFLNQIRNLQKVENIVFNVPLGAKDIQYLSGLQEKFNIVTAALLKEQNYQQAHRINQKLLELQSSSDLIKDKIVDLLFKESFSHHIIHHCLDLQRDFFLLCLPGSNFNKNGAKAKLKQIEFFCKEFAEMFQNQPLLNHLPQNQSLKDHLSRSEEANIAFCHTQKGEEEVIASLMKVKELVDYKNMQQEHDLQSFSKKWEVLYEDARNKILMLQNTNASAFNRHRVFLEHLQTLFESKKNLMKETKQAITDEHSANSSYEPTQHNDAMNEVKREDRQQSFTSPLKFDIGDEMLQGISKNPQERLKLMQDWIKQARVKNAVHAHKKKMILFIGNSGSGKSTIINALMGCSMQQNDSGQIIASDEKAHIHHGNGSGTTLVDVYVDNASQLVYGDCAGFKDSRGLEANIANAFSIRQAFQLADKVKVVIVLNSYTFDADRGAGFAELESLCFNLFGGKDNFLLAAKSDTILFGLNFLSNSHSMDSYMRIFSSNETLGPFFQKQRVIAIYPLEIDFAIKFKCMLGELNWLETPMNYCMALSADEIEDLLNLLSVLLVNMSQQMNISESCAFQSVVNEIQMFQSIVDLLDSASSASVMNVLKHQVNHLLGPFLKQMNNLYCAAELNTELLEDARKFMIVLDIADKESCTKSSDLYMKGKEESHHRNIYRETKQVWANFFCQRVTEKNSNEAILSRFYLATSGHLWKQDDGWLTDQDLKNWHGICLSEDMKIVGIHLCNNNLRGILPERVFKQLEHLKTLDVSENFVIGELPLALNQLKELSSVKVDGNSYLCGPPPKLFGNGTWSVDGTRIQDKNTEICLSFNSFSFWVVCVEEFKNQDKFVTHEEAQQKQGLLILLFPSPPEQFETFQAFGNGEKFEVHRKNILFVSHRWLTTGSNGKPGHPDDKNHTKKQQIDALFQHPGHFGDIKFMWLDYFCIPQDTSHDAGERQQRAINSIAFFVNCCSTFVTLVGENDQSTYEIYSRRGWCRFERFSAVMSEMGADMYLDNKDTKKLIPINMENTGTRPEEYNPCTGIFYDPNDKQRLEDSIIAMCSAALKMRGPGFVFKIRLAIVILSSLDHPDKQHILESLKQTLEQQKATQPIDEEKQAVDALAEQHKVASILISRGGAWAELAQQLYGQNFVTTLDWSSKHLEGGIPPELGALTNLTVLYLHYNKLTGGIPPELGALTNLTVLSLSDNQLTGRKGKNNKKEGG